MKGLAIESIAYMVLAIVAILLIIMLISGKIAPATTSAYCKFIKGLKSILPLPPHLKTPLPAFCQDDGVTPLETHEILMSDPERIAYEISAYLVACWEETGKVNRGRDILCYELIIGNVDGSVTESDVLLILEKEGFREFPLTWNTGEIKSAKSIGVKYDSNAKKIVVE